MKDFYEKYWEHRKDIDHLYKEWKPKRLQIAANELRERKCQNILDIGCGEGSLGELLGGTSTLYGIDISETALEIADKHYLETAQADIENDDILEIFDAEFDAVVCLEVLEHLFHPDKFLERLSNKLSSETVFIISVPNFVYWKHRLDILTGNLPEEYTLYESSEHISHFTPKSLYNLLTESDLLINKVMYDMHYPVIPNSLVPDFIGKLAPGLTAQQMVFVGEVK